MTVWFTSDLHFGHPFVAGLRAGHEHPDREDWALSAVQDRRMVNVLNARVAKRDELYVLGDVSSGSRQSMRIAVERLQELNVPVKRRHLILGNHELRSNSGIYEDLYPLFGEVARQARLYLDDGRQLMFSHYPWRHLMDGDQTDGRSTNATDPSLAVFAPVWTDNPNEILLYGHTHSRRIHDFIDKPGSTHMIHIGWDTWGRPVGLEEIINLINGNDPKGI